MKPIIFFILGLVPVSVFGIVDTRSAGYSKTFTDFKTQGAGYNLEVTRTYNSRSLYNGLFGFGWCSNLETKLNVLPDGSLRVVECGGGMEILYHLKGKVPNVDLYVNRILEKLKKRKVKMSEKALAKLKKDLLSSQNLRNNFLQALDMKGQAERGLKYYAQGRVKEYIVVTSNGYKRVLPNGFKEQFDKQGRLVKSSNAQGRIEIEWGASRIVVMDERGRRLVFVLNKKGGKIKAVTFGKKTVAKYVHRGEDLVQATNSKGEVYKHSYDKLHNLTKNTYPDGTTEELSYNVKKDWVIAFKDTKGCKENYEYGVNKKNANHHYSLVKKICNRKIVNNSKYEFWHKTGPKGGKYLHRARQKTNGRLQVDVIYHPVFGTPVSFFKNGVRTSRKYYSNGFLKEKDNINQNIQYSKYNQNCRKPERVAVGYKSQSNQDAISRKELISFKFNRKCQLIEARKSGDEWVRFQHDTRGRIISMEDQSRKKVSLVWHKTLNKPEQITRVGVGSIKVVYDSEGSVVQLKGLNKKEGPAVTAQVTSVFNSFLNSLGPVAEEMAIL